MIHLQILPARQDFLFIENGKENRNMEFRAVGNRCAVDFGQLNVQISQEDALRILKEIDFTVIEVDFIAIARQLVGRAFFRRDARLEESPSIFNCSGLIKWLYAQRGIWLPRRAVQQFSFGASIDRVALTTGDLVFRSGWNDFYHSDPSESVGHVGIISEDGTVIHAPGRRSGIIESSLDDFSDEIRFRGARRIIPMNSEIVTLVAPTRWEVETSDDIRWIIVQHLGSEVDSSLKCAQDAVQLGGGQEGYPEGEGRTQSLGDIPQQHLGEQ